MAALALMCQTCGRSFSTAASRRAHLRTHTGERPYVCDAPGCDKAFAHLSTLTQHRRTHSDERPFVCTAAGCSGKFRQAGQLRRHERTVHDGAKQFRCDLCAKLFTAKANLDAHLLVHADERPFVCNVAGCNRAFRQRTHLNEHRKTHRAHELFALAQTITSVKEARALLKRMPPTAPAHDLLASADAAPRAAVAPPLEEPPIVHVDLLPHFLDRGGDLAPRSAGGSAALNRHDQVQPTTPRFEFSPVGFSSPPTPLFNALGRHLLRSGGSSGGGGGAHTRRMLAMDAAALMAPSPDRGGGDLGDLASRLAGQ